MQSVKEIGGAPGIRRHWVRESTYQEHLALFPKVAVDIVAFAPSSEFVLVRRSDENNAWKRSWATPGGGVLRNERLATAAQRVLKRETGISAPRRAFGFRGVEEVILPVEHAIAVIFKVNVEKVDLRVDRTSFEARWFRGLSIPQSLRTHYRKVLTKSGVSL